MREHTRKYERRVDKIETPKIASNEKDYDKKPSKYTIEQIETHLIWREGYSIKLCKTMDYLMCESSLKFAKISEKEKTVYATVEEVNH